MAFFESIENAAPDKWLAGRNAHLVTNAGVRSYLMLYNEALKYLHGLGKIDPFVARPDQLTAAVAEFCHPLFGWLKTASLDEMETRFARRYGEGGVREYYFHLCDLLVDTHPQFGSDEYREHKRRSKDGRVAQAILDVEDMTKLISRVVIEKLKGSNRPL